ncbi:MAG: hypothetical protein H3C38_11515 [Rhodospirillales bacterium]|nr:hypothetical protein [Rhodospirillales bacterium]
MISHAILAGPAAGLRSNPSPPAAGPGNFADLVKDSFARPAPASARQSPRELAATAMPRLFGDAYDTRTGTIDMVRFARRVGEETADLAAELTRRLHLAGIDTSIPVSLTVRGDGTVSAAGDHPQRQAIEKMFADDPALANRYRKVAADNHMIATAQLASRFHQAWYDCKDEEEREKVWLRYRGLFDRLQTTSGQMTLTGGTLSSASLSLVGGAALA